jgi:hypothetical protein
VWKEINTLYEFPNPLVRRRDKQLSKSETVAVFRKVISPQKTTQKRTVSELSEAI